MASVNLQPSVFSFLEQLKKNNDRNWFTENKSIYHQEAAVVAAFAGELLKEMNKHDVIETGSGAKSLYRIYRDVRFSKDKTPYSTYWGGRFKRAGKQRRGGYYYHLEPGGKTSLICGFWAPAAPDLKLIREDIAFDPAPLRKILTDPVFVKNFGGLRGEQLKTSPKGFDGTHESIDLLRYKQFLVRRQFSDQEVLGGSFLALANQAFKDMRPFLDYMSDVLSSDTNGLPI
ncbi:DUF2461 domain-containing protein [Mucilaginibacter sp. BJC16-A38]|uniref:DUF2461 domain-containing protein n=1 Tax=Mucilaginibacter phenanthrenivorans TaxID=1234842 RepID=UPI002158345C|nr:DUF2461 domain-containing protein [Mucilaginibacter phenanthrenivorans]MCR8560311.1 DUF2461 domain-containing protein [Mucilaginibacter phenanthrenivorans]